MLAGFVSDGPQADRDSLILTRPLSSHPPGLEDSESRHVRLADFPQPYPQIQQGTAKHRPL